MKILKIFGLPITIFLICINFISCNNTNNNEIQGIWYTSVGEFDGLSFRHVYEFIDSNTVIDYGTIGNTEKGWTDYYEEFPHYNGWYYTPSTLTYNTYFINSNKIVISDGTILTINENVLLLENSNSIYKRW